MFNQETQMYQDWCPLCGTRFKADTVQHLADAIVEHAQPEADGKSYCEKHLRPFEQVLADDHF